MIISIKDGFKLIGISIICLCAAFVCTFMLNFYVDAHSIAYAVTEQTITLYEAQLATAQFSSAITGGVLSVTSVIMLIFYVKLFVDFHSTDLGVMKAMGYSELKLSVSFWVFGLSVFVGTALGVACGFIAMPMVYDGLSVDGLPEIAIKFHPALTFTILLAPPAIFSAVAIGYAYFALKKPTVEMIRGIKRTKIKLKPSKRTDAPFLTTLCFGTLKNKKSLVFFVAFACFCFSSMVQMGASMENLVRGAMGIMILAIGLVLAVTIIILAVTSLVNANKKNVAILKAFGYSPREITAAIFVGYLPFAFLGFAVGTLYQYGLLTVMINFIFKDVGEIPAYSFNVPIMFVTFAAFLIFYSVINVIYAAKLCKIPVKEIMGED